MTKYRRVLRKDKTRYMRENKPGRFVFIAAEGLTPSIREKLDASEVGEVVDELDGNMPEYVPKPKSCAFCDEPATKQRYVSGQMVELCEEDYQYKSLGEISGILRQKN